MESRELLASGEFRDRAKSVIDDVFGGDHHVGKIKWIGDAWKRCEFTTFESSISTFDFSYLTRLVVAAHDHCVRVAVENGGPRRLKVIISERKLNASDALTGGHPALEEHVAAIRKGSSRAMQELYDSMEKKRD